MVSFTPPIALPPGKDPTLPGPKAGLDDVDKRRKTDLEYVEFFNSALHIKYHA
jgi:hypothetical protein